ncbi:hypothetical protein OSH11_20760 [Kaistia dalseonensis]|uniref:Cell division protein FtsL n=1 Tax=Kaistia dalseonensis TaxID=410840 RepID=A0ABU0HBT7_9HYPH|nr:hypothetical protein [Kaistia dalseonensis]MCX5497148.1 hypothetical protein [Kaistia dalseonensis]MDQ0439775.1 hypothetical protein [Kaistia dalseonensis]
MMSKTVNVVWVALMVTGAVFTYAMKDGAGRAADRVMALRADIAREKEQLTVLKAEWSVLDQPARLQSLVARYGSYLNLQPLDVRQLASIADVPAKPPTPDAGLDTMRTATIPKAPSSVAQSGIQP